MPTNPTVTIHNLTPGDVAVVFALQQKYEHVFPGAQITPGELYLSPAFHDGQDVFCAFEDDCLLAYAPVYLQAVEAGPTELPHTAWVEIKADPDLPEPQPVKDLLYNRLLERIQGLASELPARRVHMSFQYHPNETPAIEYIQAKGFAYAESVFGMECMLPDPLPQPPIPEGIEIRLWKMDSQAEQTRYVAARNECFPEAPITLGEWQYFLTLPVWADGTTVAAFDGEELVGNVSVFWNEDENARSSYKVGYTEYIFVRPAWRGKGIAQAMIAEGMRYLQAHDIAAARLEVRAQNTDALNLYQKLGYQVGSESRFYSKDLGFLGGT